MTQAISCDERILVRIREVLPDLRCTDKEAMAAYNCWQIYAGQDWSEFYLFINPDSRKRVYGGTSPDMLS